MSKKAGDVIWIGLALFAMFFGAGNLIFPPFLGFIAGTSWSIAMIGFLITGIGMPLLGIMASSRAGGTVERLAGRVSPLFGRILSIVIILAIGPLLAIPRTAATTFEMGVRPNIPSADAAISSLVYFAITLFFAFNRRKVVDEIAKIIIAAMSFKGYSQTSDQVKMTSLAGLVSAIGLGLVYGGLMYLGASSVRLFPRDIERTDLLIRITQGLLGGTGKIILGLAVALACLTTSIGLTATVGDYFSNLSKGKLGYKGICVTTCVFSAVFATVGVTTIVRVAVPLLVTVYPGGIGRV